MTINTTKQKNKKNLLPFPFSPKLSFMDFWTSDNFFLRSSLGFGGEASSSTLESGDK